MNNMFTMLQQFRNNPLQILQQRFNIPQNVHDPNQILQHLLDTKQVSQQQIDNIKQFTQMFVK